jgi:hypothetical protein
MNGWVLWHDAISLDNKKRSSNLRWYSSLSELVSDSKNLNSADNYLRAWVSGTLSDMYYWFLQSGNVQKKCNQIAAALNDVYEGFD